MKAAIKEVFRPSSMDGDNQWFCPVCKSLKDATSEVKLTRASEVLIVQLQRFTQLGPNQFIKNNLRVSCDREVSLIEKGPDPQVRQIYKLLAIIDHSGSYTDGHYTSFVLDRSSDKWFLCNDSVIKQTDLALCKNPYVLFYVLKSFDA